MGHRNLLRPPVLKPGMNRRFYQARFDRYCSKARQGAVIGCGQILQSVVSE